MPDTQQTFAIDWAHIGSAIAYFAAAVVVVIVGKWSRDLWALRRGHQLNVAISRDDNTAVAIEQSAFVVSLVIGLLGSIVVASESWLGQAADFAVTALIVVGALHLAERLTARLVLRGLDLDNEVVSRGNAAVALARAGGVVATALVLRSAIGHDSLVWERLIWLLIGQVALVAMTLLYQKITPYDDIAELRGRNLAAAMPLACLQVAVGLIIEAALKGEGSGWTADLLSVGGDLLIAAVALPVLRWLCDLLLLHDTNFTDEIARDRNVGAGLVEGSSYLAAAWAIAFFIS